MRFLIALLWAIFITYLHAIPGNDITFFQLDDLFQLDKLFHLGVFFYWNLAGARLRIF